MKQLKVHVERIVHSIRASARRKDKMREELLAHLTGTLEEEMAKGENEEAALERALRRFGDPDPLRQELQASVPVIERILFVPLAFTGQSRALSRRFSKRQDESVIGHAGRITAYVTLPIVSLDVFLIGLIVLTTAFNGPALPEIIRRARLAAAFHVPLALCWFPYVILLHAFRRAVRLRPLRLGQLILAGAYCALSVLVTASCCVAIYVLKGDQLMYSPEGLGFVFKILVGVTPLAFVAAALGGAAELRRYEEWESLVTEE